jgi:hypothetical protein
MGSNVLHNSILPLTLLRERARKDLVEELDKMRGSKALVMDRSLSGPLGLIAEKQLIKDHGVEKTYHLRCYPAAALFHSPPSTSPGGKRGSCFDGFHLAVMGDSPLSSAHKSSPSPECDVRR